MSNPRTCQQCGMYYHEWLGEPGEAALIPNMHECPEPFPRDVAEALLQFHVSSRIPCHPKTAARIRLGLACD